MDSKRIWRAFTLIELLVVIAIIAILAAILFPVFAKARERAKTSQCISNLRQVGLGLMQYVDDNDDTYPVNRYYQGIQFWTWKRALDPYLKSKDLWKCPSVTNYWAKSDYYSTPAPGDESNLNERFRGRTDEHLPASYAFGGGFFHESATFTAAHPYGRARRRSEARDPSALIFLVNSRMGFPDLGPWCIGWRATNNFNSWHVAQPSEDGKGPFMQHSGRVPFAMADGHVEVLKLAQTYSPVDRWGHKDYPASRYRSELEPRMADEYR